MGTHLWHARRALGALVPEDDDHSRGDLALLERIEERRDARRWTYIQHYGPHTMSRRLTD